MAAVVVAGSLVACCSPPVAEEEPTPSGPSLTLDERQMEAVDEAINSAIAAGDIPGAVLLVSLGGEAVYREAYGQRAVEPVAEAMTADTVFDLASLTKPIATATSVMILVDRGEVDLHAPVATYLPAFGANGKEAITVEQLLLHRGGLAPANPLSDFDEGVEAGLAKVYERGTRWEPGTEFHYTDVGYIVLGELVEAVDGRPLNVFAREEIFEPLGMDETTYLPPSAWEHRTAPTEQRDGRWMRGQVHDPRAWAMGGVAGHAGLFSTADDLARFCEMLIRGGVLDGERILSEATVREMTRVRYLPDGSDGRGYGLDIDTGYSSPRGERLAVGTTFGHTGFTGTSFWIDPEHELTIILLTNRVHPDGDGRVVPLRREIATLIATAILGEPEPEPEPADADTSEE